MTNEEKLQQMRDDLDDILNTKTPKRPIKYTAAPKYQKASINHKKKKNDRARNVRKKPKKRG